MTDFAAKQFTIDSTLELVADQFTAELPDSKLFRGASLSDRISLSAGLRSGTSPVTIQAIAPAVIDEYEVTITPNSITGRVRGRDPASNILDSFYDVSFHRTSWGLTPQVTVLENTPDVTIDVLAPAGGFPASLLPASTAGFHRASDIARVLVNSVGLDLAWEVRDYELVNQFEARGRIIDLLRRLIEPWVQVEPFQADIFLQGNTVIIRQRQLPGVPLVADSQHTFDIRAARRSQVVVRKRLLRKVGLVILEGRAVPGGSNVVATEILNDGGVGGSGGTQTVSYRNEAFDASGALVQRTEITDKFRIPDRILLETQKVVLTKGQGGALQLTSTELIENRWEASIYDQTGPVNSPKQLEQTITRSGIDPADDAALFRVLAVENTTYKYDDMGFLRGETTVVRKFDLASKILQYDTMTVKTIRDVGPLISEQITEVYRFDTDKKQWILRTRDTTLGGGHRPGGPGRGIGGTAGLERGGGFLDGGPFVNVRLVQTLSTDSDAIEVEYRNENLTQNDLQGLYEWEFQFDGIAMPWLRRGDVIKFVGVKAEDNSDFLLPAALIRSVNTSYDESRPEARYTMSCRSFAYVGIGGT
jgi:hypothetical protein